MDRGVEGQIEWKRERGIIIDITEIKLEMMEEEIATT